MLSKNLIRCAAAGAGKTWGICHDALEIVNAGADEKVLITTYTNKGVEAVEKELKKQNFGVLDNRVVVSSWYQFLLRDLIRPYQTFLTGINEVKSFDFSNMYSKTNYGRTGTRARYVNRNGDVKANYASEMVTQLDKLSGGKVLQRLEAIYSYAFVDEIQDMAGYDLAIIDMLINSSISTVCVGDNKQATYRTHNTQKGKKQTGANVWVYFYDVKKRGFAEIEDNLCSRRFNKKICQFANKVFPNENNITTCMNEKTVHDGVFLIRPEDVPVYYDCYKPIVLKYDKTTPTGGYSSFNFGQCKGMTFERVLIYPNKPLLKFICGEDLSSPAKYYVAFTRPKYSLAIVVEDMRISNSFHKTIISTESTEISAWVYNEQ
jgi:DNA helicase-2/ATP-dependent DNA helicase PcrA